MVRVATDYLDNTSELYGNKIAFVDDKRELTFSQMKDEAYHIAYELVKREIRRRPIVVFLDKSVECIAAFQGIAYSGNFYVPIDTEMPRERILKIMDKLEPQAVITDRRNLDKARESTEETEIFCYENIILSAYDTVAIDNAKKKIIDTDALYVLFTSGSTGIPKGVVISHKGLVDFTEWAAENFAFSSENIIANQTPFYFSMSIFDIYQTLRNGSTTHVVPKKLFAQPVRLMNYLAERKVDVLNWVPSALSYISILKALDRPHLDSLRTVLFGGEVFQMKQLNRWRREYTDVRFINIYGPTEVTDTCTFYEVDREFADNEMLPVGTACRNKEIILLDEYNREIRDFGTIGEVCVRGSGLAHGYYNDFEKTEEVFVQNPLNSAYKELIYRTGDLGKLNEYGEIVYVSRKDFQIKHKGHRIELNEIESVCTAIDAIEECCCVYDAERQQIVLFYVGTIESGKVLDKLRTLLPDYMIPGRRIQLSVLPKNLNGKTDRKSLSQQLQGE